MLNWGASAWQTFSFRQRSTANGQLPTNVTFAPSKPNNYAFVRYCKQGGYANTG